MMQQRNLPSNVKRKPDTDVRNEASKADGVKNESTKTETSAGEPSNTGFTDATIGGRDEARVDGPSKHSLSYEKMEDLRVLFHEEEIKELKLLLESEREQNRHLVELLRKSRLQTSHDKTNISKALPTKRHPPIAEASTDPSHPAPGDNDNSVDEITLPYGATLEPLLVNVPPLGPRPPMLRECQGIVRHLQQTIDRQAHELNQLKTDLRDVLYSHKWTPDAFLLARAYIADDDAEDTDSGTSPARVPMKHATRRIPDAGYTPKDTLSLPPIKNSVGNQSIERQKRVQSLQKSRAINHFTSS